MCCLSSQQYAGNIKVPWHSLEEGNKDLNIRFKTFTGAISIPLTTENANKATTAITRCNIH